LGNITVDINSGSTFLSWIVDGSGGGKSYTIYRDSVIVQSGSWSPNGEIIYEFIPEAAGIFNVTIMVEAAADFARDTLFVEVIDELNFVSTPGNRTFSVQSSNRMIDWVARDSNPATFKIYQNQSLRISSGWVSDIPIEYHILDTEIGIYNITIVLFDQDGGQIKDTIFVTLSSGPVIANSADLFVAVEGEVNATISWEVVGNGNNYIVFVNNSQSVNGSWFSGLAIEYSLNTSTINQYEVALFANDSDGEFTWQNLTAIITDRPQVLQEPTFLSSYDESGTYDLSWQFSDNQPDIYQILLNQTLMVSDTWNATSPVNYTLDNVNKGNYSLMIIAFDQYGVNYTSTYPIVIKDTSIPQIVEKPIDQEYAYNTTLILLQLLVEDRHPNNYTVSIDDDIVQESDWTDTITFTFLLRELGEYEVKFEIYDESENVVVDFVYITIVDRFPPELIDYIGLSVSEYGTDTLLTWQFADFAPSEYQILSNHTSTILEEEIWNNNFNITYSLSDFNIGHYNITLSLWDSSDNHREVHQIISIIPIQTNEPVLNDDGKTYSGRSSTYSGSWITNSGTVIASALITSSLQLNDSNITSTTSSQSDGFYSLEFDFSNVSSGNYSLIFEFRKGSHQNWTVTQNVEVKYLAVNIDISYPSSIKQGERLDITVKASYAEPPALRLLQTQDNEFPVDLTVTLYVVLVDLDRTERIVEQLLQTDDEGSAILSIFDTMNLHSIQTIQVWVPEGQFVQTTQVQMDETFIDVRAGSLNNWFIITTGLSTTVMILIIVALLIFPLLKLGEVMKLGVYKAVTYRNRKFFNELAKINVILIFNKNGILFYDRNCRQTQNQVDPTLIAALSSAITSFIGELQQEGRENSGFQFMERQNFNITIHSLNDSSVALLSSEMISSSLRGRVALAHQDIEQNFKPEFERGIGDLHFSDLMTIDRIFETYQIPVELMSGIEVSVENLVRKSKSHNLSAFLRYYLGRIVEHPSIPLYSKFTLTQLVFAFEATGVKRDIAIHLILELQKKHMFQID
jgi:hypothetical protein